MRTFRSRALVVCLLAAATAARARAAERVAVLEFTGNVTPEVLRAATERARAAALGPVTRVGYSVMTRESTSLVIQEMGGKCIEGQCEIEIARSVGAALVITGEIRKLGASYLGDVKLHDTEKGTLLAVQSFQSSDELATVGQTTGATETMLAGGLERYFGKPVEVMKKADAPRPYGPRNWYVQAGAGYPISLGSPVAGATSGGGAYFQGSVGRRFGPAWAIELGGGGTVGLGTYKPPATATVPNPGSTELSGSWFLLSAVWAPFRSFRYVSLAAQGGVALVGAQYTDPTGGGYGESTTSPAGGLELRLDLPLGEYFSFGVRTGVLYAQPASPAKRTAPDGAEFVPEYGALTIVSATAGLAVRF